MNKGLERRIRQDRQKRADPAKTLAEMRNEGATGATGDLTRNVAADKRKLKAARNRRRLGFDGAVFPDRPLLTGRAAIRDHGAMPTLNVPSAVGPLTLEEQDGAIVRLGWGDSPDDLPDGTPTPLLAEAARQIAAYFDGTLTAFDLPLAPRGSNHQKRVWRAMAEILHGETLTYGELAKRAGSVPRAVGGACGANPIPVILPCHRVVAANGGSGGFSGKGGLKTKSALLDIENPDLRLF